MDTKKMEIKKATDSPFVLIQIITAKSEISMKILLKICRALSMNRKRFLKLRL